MGAREIDVRDESGWIQRTSEEKEGAVGAKKGEPDLREDIINARQRRFDGG